MQANAEDVLSQLFIYPDTYLNVGRSPRQVFTREMGILAAKRLMPSEGPRSPLECSDSYSWMFDPIRIEVHLVLIHTFPPYYFNQCIYFLNLLYPQVFISLA